MGFSLQCVSSLFSKFQLVCSSGLITSLGSEEGLYDNDRGSPPPPFDSNYRLFPLLDKGGLCISSWESGVDMKVSYSQATVQHAGFIPVFACRGLQCKAFNWADLGYKVFAIVFQNIFSKRWWRN